ncbi:MAG: phosphoenolpyruvate hydrolase family protein [Pirellulaceae bacterium]|nr:phosphoenolpyruvate hydrolase family protein [Pirellulaceae bacterium]
MNFTRCIMRRRSRVARCGLHGCRWRRSGPAKGRRIDGVLRHQCGSDGICWSHGGPILSPADAAYINEHTDAVGFFGASNLERMAFEDSLTNLTREFKCIPVNHKL